ncbi:bile acid:sodium symporter [Bacteroides gallinaceum]|uniref:Bile acid:sodium symporter n=2 Tax=Bacteroidaceae TaxID=815 RepID=A0ABT7X610_9BACE|nr:MULTISPECIES: bile acid:sodium symporter [Bacteroidaceae]CCZ69740.1 bile acid:sodium symporter [Bacteroides sp. CAG:702]MBD8041717.1 bile acid:sodium symporter [Phocaeicola intestinalis]MBM6945261.1 bile acid:sodium symporter [Bacteroides gallinaceum]MDN0049523.1 bile acid:sodium symporter [Bacteroides gallinaceum]MDN0067834.1 bile acid:sodium symporter [Bacteroides gallinaceum]
MLQFIKNWTLPLAMLAGVIGYFCFAMFDFLHPLKPFVKFLVVWLTPLLIFAQLLLTFCKIEVKDLSPRRWTCILLLIQLISCLAVAGVLLCIPFSSVWRISLEGAMVCLICPTATAAAVITNKLGGSAASLTTYTLASNLLAAIVVPLVFPLVEPSDIPFGESFMRILGKVFPLLLFPFFIAVLLRRYAPPVHQFLVGLKDMAFYLWGISLTIVMGQTTQSVIEGNTSIAEECIIAALALVICCLQFWGGKSIGGKYHDRISGGQALGQKNTVLAIWMAATYLNPLTTIAPGSYVVWQNTINSWQLWKKRKSEERITKHKPSTLNT